jgi:hypothetical protein
MKKPRADERRGLWILYRALQVHHQLANIVAEPILPSMIATAEFLIIVCAYSLIKSQPTDNPIIPLTAVSVGFIVTFNVIYGFRLNVKSTEGSEKCLAVVKEIEILELLSKDEKMVLKSMYSLKWKIGYGGNGFRVTRQSILTIFQDIIITNLINLIIMG